MNVEAICKTILKVFNKHLRPPAPRLNPYLVWCSAFRKPGLSVNISVSNIIQDLSKKGIPTENGPDGQPNFTNKLVHSMVKEVYRALREDMNVQGATQPGMSGVAELAACQIPNSFSTVSQVQ